MNQELRHQVSKWGLIVAGVLLALGSIISHVPGAEQNFYPLPAIAASLGLLSPRRGLRVVAAVLLGLSLLMIWYGYDSAREYRQRMQDGDQHFAPERAVRVHRDVGPIASSIASAVQGSPTRERGNASPLKWRRPAN